MKAILANRSTTELSPPALKQLSIVVEGGEMCSLLDTPATIRTIEEMIRDLPLVVRSLISIHDIDMPERVLLPGDHISMQRVARLRDRILQKLREGSNVLAIVGRAKIGRYSEALAMGIDPEEMGIVKGQEQAPKKSILLAATQGTLFDSNEPNDALKRAMKMFIQSKKEDGRAGALLGERIYALPGLSVSKDDPRPQSRFPHIGSFDKADRRWAFREGHPAPHPKGITGAFGLESGVKTSDEEFLSASDSGEGEIQTGAVIQTHVEGDPFMEVDGRTLQQLDSHDIPVVLVREWMKGLSGPPSPWESKFQRLVDGGAMMSGGAKVLLAHALNEAKARNLQSPDEVIQYVRKRFAEYPFR